MLQDRYSGRHSTDAPDAVAHFEDAVTSLAAHQPIGSALQAAARIDPDMPALASLAGIGLAMMGREIGFEQSRALLPRTRATLARARGGEPSERALAAAHEHAAQGAHSKAAAALELHVERHPGDFLALKLAHGLRFMTGEPGRMLAVLEAALRDWSHRDVGYGFLLGCRAFALGETGSLVEAEVCGRMAVLHQPDDAWGLHAVAHVMETAGRTSEGKAWLEPTRGRWAQCGPFGQHLAWHLALFHLAEGDTESALSIFDQSLIPARDGDFRDVANAVSLLARLEQEGIDVGDRWDGLHEIASARRRDCSYMFASLHYLLSLIGSGDDAGAEDLVDAMRQDARSGMSEQSVLAARIGLPVAEAMLAAARQREVRAELPVLARRIPRLGGSNAQRDVFLRALMCLAADAGDATSLASLSAVRLQQRRHDRFQAIVEQRLAEPTSAGRLAGRPVIALEIN